MLAKEKEKLDALFAESARILLPDPSPKEDAMGRSAVQKILKLGQRCARKGPMQKSLALHCKRHNMKPLKMVKCVPTRWNTMYNVINRALRLKEPLHYLCVANSSNLRSMTPSKRLNRFDLSDEQWELMGQFEKPLEVSYRFSCNMLCHFQIVIVQLLNEATCRISTSSYPMLHQVIPMMEILFTEFEAMVNDVDLPDILRRAVQKGLIVLDKYYSLTDESIMWKTVMRMSHFLISFSSII